MRSLAEQRKSYVERLERAVAELPDRLAAMPAVHRAILFGSWVRGRRDLLTDLDLVVILESDLPFPDRAAALHRDLGLDVDADILAYTPGEWERVRHRPMMRRVADEGRVLYERRSGP